MTEKYGNMNNDYDRKPDEFSSAKHSVRRKKRERKIRKTRKKLNRLKTFLRFVLTVIMIAFCYFIIKLPQWYLAEDTFKNPENHIEIVNNHIIPDYVFYNSLKNLKVSNLPIFLVKVKPILHEIYKIPVVKKVYVRRYGFPARFQIIIRERTPVVIIKTNLNSMPEAFFTSDEVLVINRSYMNISENNTLKILTTKDGLKKEINIKKIREIQKIVKDVETYSNEKVEYIDISNPNDVYVKIQSINIRLGVLDSTVYERIKRIYTILPQISNEDNKIQYIDLSWDKVNYLKLQTNNKKPEAKPQDNKDNKENKKEKNREEE